MSCLLCLDDRGTVLTRDIIGVEYGDCSSCSSRVLNGFPNVRTPCYFFGVFAARCCSCRKMLFFTRVHVEFVFFWVIIIITGGSDFVITPVLTITWPPLYDECYVLPAMSLMF